MPSNLRESGFEEHIEQCLVSGQNYLSRSSREHYDKALCIDPELVMRFIAETQPKEWAKLAEHHGERLQEKFFKRLDEEIQARGLLDVLRNGVKDNGCSFQLAYFQPTSLRNPEIALLFTANILSVMRQVKYSTKNDNSIDMVLFLNGLPICTVELKNQLTGQSIVQGMKQYRTDRDSKEKLLSFKRCLVHMAVDTEEVRMTTKLQNSKTYFLPFNKGYNFGAGNPVREGEYKTAYMWEDIWSKKTLLEIVGRFMHLQKLEETDAQGKVIRKEVLIFPRYHQLQTVRDLVQDATDKGAGCMYLIEHSAGSGKSNTIAWTSHHLAELHGEDNQKVFDSIIVITDRRILDRQLRHTVQQFEQVSGVVKAITEGSQELKMALESGEKIIITTLQKFPVIVADMGLLPGKRFAVIVDEAHSSQSGESTKSLKQVLSTTLERAEKEDEAIHEVDFEDQVVREMQSRGRLPNVSFFAFTATPKQKTLELFGEKQKDGSYVPFSVYSMRQAIEEGFILNTLKNYTTYKTYFNLLKKAENDPEYQKSKAQRLMVNYVDLHEHTVGMKVRIIGEHFLSQIKSMTGGKAKAMIVTKSRLHAVRYKIAMDTWLRENNIPIKALVAFSGTVRDGGLDYTESGMNNGVPETNTAREFAKDEYKFLIVAEKFQTGFDQPLLTTMYVDKKLSGVNAVQTLSRLNRTHPDKEDVFVLDFVNETDDIKNAFQPYYQTTILSEGTDPNILHNLQHDILQTHLFTEQEVGELAKMYLRNATPNIINSFLDQIVERFVSLEPEQQEELRGKILDYVRKYAFLSQILTFTDSGLEKLYIFLRILRLKLPLIPTELPLEVLEKIDLESIKIPRISSSSIELEAENLDLEPMGGSKRGKSTGEHDFLSKILKEVNERFGTEFSDDDRLILNSLSSRLLQNKKLQGTVINNPKDAAMIRYEKMYQDEKIEMLNTHYSLYSKLDRNKEIDDYVKKRIFDFIYKNLIEE